MSEQEIREELLKETRLLKKALIRANKKEQLAKVDPVDLSDILQELADIKQQQARIIELLESKIDVGELEREALSLLRKELEK